MKPDQVAKRILETDKSAKEVAEEAIEEQGAVTIDRVVDYLVDEMGMNRGDAENAVTSREGEDIVDGSDSVEQAAKEIAKNAPDHVYN